MAKIKEPSMVPLSKEFAQPDGYPDTVTVNQRVMAAAARLKVRGTVPQPNPLVTAWQLHALLRVLTRKGLLEQRDLNEIMYFTAWEQMQDLERLVEQDHTSRIVVPRGKVIA